MRSFLTLTLLLLLSIKAAAQTGGIEGVVSDESGELLLNTPIQVTEGGILKANKVTDIDGRYLIKPLNAGTYEVKVSIAGYITEIIQGVPVVDAQNTTVNVTLTHLNLKPEGRRSSTKFRNPKEGEVHVSCWTRPRLVPTEPGSHCKGNISDIDIESISSHSEIESQSVATSEPTFKRAIPEKHGIEWTDPGSRTILMGGE